MVTACPESAAARNNSGSVQRNAILRTVKRSRVGNALPPG
jgi:hypothetical protein